MSLSDTRRDFSLSRPLCLPALDSKDNRLLPRNHAYPNLWRGGSAVVPFMNWFKSHEDSREDLQHWNIENMGDPKENYEKWYDASPYFFLDRVNAPVQLICGGNDLRCPASDSLDAHDKLTELGKDVELLLYEDEGHSFLQIENVIDAEVRRVDFLAKVLERNNVQEHTWRD